MLDPTTLMFIAVGCLAGTGALVWHLFLSPDRRAQRVLRRTPRRAIAEVVEGQMVKLVGEVRYKGDPLTSPLSGRHCAAYQVCAQSKRPLGGKDSWSTLAQATASQDFFVTQGDDEALVQVVLPTMVLTMLEVVANPVNAGRLEQFAVDYALKPGDPISSRRRFIEGIIEEGERVAVCGVGRWEPDPEQNDGYRQAARRLVIQAGEFGKLFLTDDPELL